MPSLQNKVGFLEMNDIIEKALGDIAFIEQPDLKHWNIRIKKHEGSRKPW